MHAVGWCWLEKVALGRLTNYYCSGAIGMSSVVFALQVGGGVGWGEGGMRMRGYWHVLSGFCTARVTRARVCGWGGIYVCSVCACEHVLNGGKHPGSMTHMCHLLGPCPPPHAGGVWL